MSALLILSRVLMLVLFSLSADTLESGPDCIPSIRVLRNTVWRARVTDVLMINCTVVSEPPCWENISVTWCRIDDKNGCRPLIHSSHTSTEWRSFSQSKRMSVLIFWSIYTQDAGLYRCQITSPEPSVSHAINVTVTESGPDCIPSIRVPRNTVWRARVTDVLMINCTVVSEPPCWENISVTWCRIDHKNECRPLIHSSHTSNEWRSVSQSKRMSVLIFWKISIQDSGLYRCEITSPTTAVSHKINVTVTDAVSTQITTAGSPAVTVPVTVETPLSVEVQFSVIYISVFVVAVVLTVPLIMSRGGKKCQKDEVAMTTVIYEPTGKFSVQD